LLRRGGWSILLTSFEEVSMYVEGAGWVALAYVVFGLTKDRGKMDGRRFCMAMVS
jgi:ABC-type uncharacterized transport system permease subunit